MGGVQVTEKNLKAGGLNMGSSIWLLNINAKTANKFSKTRLSLR
jgi:hypothetical protein